MGEITISLPLGDDGIDALSKEFYDKCGSQEEIKRISKALQRAKDARYPRSKRFKYGSLMKGFTNPQLQEFFSLFRPEEYRFRLYCLYCVWFGMRQGEAYRLNLRDISFDRQSLMIFREKGEGPQEFPVEDGLWAELQNYVLLYEREIREANGCVFFSASRTQRTTGKTKHWASGWIRSKFREVLARSNSLNNTYANATNMHPRARARKLYQFTPHSLRYTHAYIAFEVFNNVKKVQDLLGHKSIISTQGYLDNFAKAKVKENSVFLQKNTVLKEIL